jgi:hypothetical protein
VEGLRGIQAGLTGHGENQASTTCCTWQRPVVVLARPVVVPYMVLLSTMV